MRKRILSILLTLCMVLSIAPATVFAEDSVVTEVSTAEDLTTAIENSAVSTVKLTADINISNSLTVNRTVTLDLNGHVLKYESANKGSVIVVENGGQLTIEDSNTSNLSHKFNPNGKLWVLDEASGTETVTGGVITGGTGTDISTFGGTTWYCGGGALIKNGGSLTMRGGNIIGCSAECGGGVCIDSEQGQFSMSGGSIAGCVASDIGGGVFASGTFKMSGPAVIRSCTADQLKLFRDKVNDAKTEEETKICAVLTSAIDLNNEPWTPIGNYTEGNQIYYEGTFDGGGHTISGLNVTGNFRYASLFGAVKGGTIKNLTVAGNVSHNYYSTSLDCHVGGIVGGALDAATIENCSNNCSVTGSSRNYIGGIAGSNIDNARIIDCYNVGTITGRIHETGGVTGLNMSTISNCYNVGTIKTLYNSDAVGEIVGRNNGTVENCYYLAGTNLNAVGQNNSNGNITKTESKTAANFANDTVLALLKAGERDNNADPWADECKYLNAVGKTLPVFNGQGDAHDHQSNDWKSNETEHWQVCTCGAVFHKAEHSGGKATCTEKAKCAVCGAEYGDVLGHDFTTSWTHDDNEHWKQCSRCDIKDDVSPHTWNNGTITTAPTCTKAGKKTYSCTKCDATKIEPIPATGHSWKSDWTSDATHHWHECANENCDVTDNAGKDGYAEHSGGTATCTEKAVCTHCGQSYGETNPVNHTGTEQWTQTTTTHEKKWNCCNTVSVPNENHEWADGVCSECGYVCLHEDTDKNHICDICGKTISDHKDADNNHLCDYCGEKISNHTGGKATCIAKAVCEICKESYGSLDPNNHTDLKHIDAKAATAAEEGNIEYWYCSGCKKYYKDAKATQEITEAQIVTAKLPSDNNGSNNKPGNNATTSPQTGDNSNLALWIALLFISGGAVTATTVYGRKKKHSVK